MTQLVLILGINLAGLALAMTMARWASMRDASSVEIRRLGSAIERASHSFLAACFRQVALAMSLVAVLLAAMHLYIWQSGPPTGGPRYIVWSLLGLLLGGLLTCIVTHYAVRLAHHASLKAIAALRVSSDRTLSVSMRSGGSLGLLSECTGVLGICLLFSLLLAITGDTEGAVVAGAAYMLGGFALGTALAALVIQRSGSVYHTASEVGAELGGERDADLSVSDPRNPAAVAKLVGAHVGHTASKTVELFVCGAVANAAVLLVGAKLFSTQLAAGSFGLLLLPIIVKSFGVLASAFGVLVVRTDEKSNPVFGIWRGHATTLVICVGALMGSTLWIIGQPDWPAFFVAGTLGLLVSAATAYSGAQRAQRRLPSMRTLFDALKVGDAALLAEGLGVGLRAAIIPSLAATVALIGAWQLGQATAVTGGGMLAVSLALMTMLASGPFMLAANILAPVSSSAHGIHCIAGAKPKNEDFERRATRIQEASSFADAFAQSFWILVGGVATLFVASSLLIPRLTPLTSKVEASNLAHPAVAYAGLLGATLVLAYAGGVLQSASRSMRGVVVEVERQLRGFPKERGKFLIPPDYIPSYRACIEIIAKSALTRHIVPVSLAVVLPLILGPLISISTGTSSGTVRAAMASFVLAGAVTGLTASFAAQATRSCLGGVRRQARSKPGSTGSGMHANGFAELFGGAAGPAAQLVFKTAAVGSLTVAPFLS